MVEPPNGTVVTNSSCYVNSTIGHLTFEETTVWKASEKYQWTEAEQDMLLGCFYYGYVLSVWPSGIIADMIGARYVIFFSLSASSICGLFYPICAHWGYGYLVALRVIQGLVQGGIFPPQSSLWGRWAPVGERTILLGITQMVPLLGNIFANSLTALICDQLGWQWAFYIFSIIGLILSFIWLIYFRNSPSEMSWISQSEIDLIQSGQNHETARKVPFSAFPFRSVFTSPPFLAICYTGISGNVAVC